MGTLHSLPVAELIARHSLRHFVETGTGTGTGLRYAATFAFASLHSVEIWPAQATAMQTEFLGDPRITIACGESPAFLQDLLPRLPPEPALFWLDAHFPGADLGHAAYDAEPDLDRRFPLERELNAIADLRCGRPDVILIDDLRVYERGPHWGVDLLAQGLAHLMSPRPLDEALLPFRTSHSIEKHWRDEGYLLLAPLAARP